MIFLTTADEISFLFAFLKGWGLGYSCMNASTPFGKFSRGMITCKKMNHKFGLFIKITSLGGFYFVAESHIYWTTHNDTQICQNINDKLQSCVFFFFKQCKNFKLWNRKIRCPGSEVETEVGKRERNFAFLQPNKWLEPIRKLVRWDLFFPKTDSYACLFYWWFTNNLLSAEMIWQLEIVWTVK